MIIFGSKTTGIATEKIPEKCLSCGTPNSIQMNIFQKYAHVFWIPFLPIGKTGITQCQHCKHLLEKKEFSGALVGKYESLKTKSKTPLWTFAGIAILVVLIASGVINSKQNDAKNAQLILTPQQGDLYEIKLGFKQYTLYKVGDVVGDTAFLLINDYETNKISGLKDLKEKGDDAYNSEYVLPVSKEELKTMLNTGEIVDIERD